MKVAVVGEHPRLNPRAKAILYNCLNKAGIDDFDIVNILSEAPPVGKNITKTMIKANQLTFYNELKQYDYLLLMGNVPCEAILGKKGIRSLRGRPLTFENWVCVPVYHPNQAVYDDKWIDIIIEDMIKLKECVDFGGIPEEKELDFVIVDTADKVDDMIKSLTGKVSIDLETSRLCPFTTSLDTLIEEGTASDYVLKTHKSTHGNNNLPRVVAMQFGCRDRQWVVPMETAGIWSSDELKQIVKRVTKALKDCFCIFHNGKFDALWMLVRFKVRWRIDFDTMMAHYLVDENDFHGLKYLAQRYLKVFDWDVKGQEKTSWSHTNAKYAAHDVFYTRKLFFKLNRLIQKEPDVEQLFHHVVMPCVRMFVDIEYNGIYIDASRMDEVENYLQEQLKTSRKNIKKWGKLAVKVDKNTGEINWNSSDQLADLLFNVLGIPSIEKTKGGKESVSESVLKRIDHPICEDLLTMRTAQKQLSTFIQGWAPYLDNNSYLHPVFKLHGTVTGRLSCENPNLQQVPRDPLIRSLITAPEGWELIEVDLSQIELRIAAQLADEYNLIQVFVEGGDPHWQTAIREIERAAGYKKEILETVRLHHEVIGKPYKKMNYSEAIEYLLKIGGKQCEEIMPMWKETRKKAKAINFGYLYGMWWKKFKMYARDNYGVNVTDEEAQASREAFFELYPKFNSWHKRQRNFVSANGYVVSLSGRKRRLPAAMSNEDTPERREAQRQAINSPVQSFANELNLMAALQMFEEFSPSWFKIVGTVHDAILMIVRKDKVEHVFRRSLEIMSNPDLLDTLDINLKVPIEADGKIGPWSKGKDLDKWL